MTQRQMILGAAAAGAAAIAGLYGILFQPLAGDLERFGLECRTVEAEAAKGRGLLNILKEQTVQRDFIPEENVSSAIGELTAAGKANGVPFLSITPQAVDERPGFSCKILPIEIQTESDYRDLGIFLGALDELRESLVTVQELDVVPNPGVPGKLKTKLILHMVLAGSV